MILKIKRTWRTDKSTIGLLYIYNDKDPENSLLRVFTLEDIEREVKIKGQTAIPKGSYELEWTWSPKFQRNVIMLKDVPNFSRVYFHAGNKSSETEGCILSGLIREKDKVVMSNQANAAIYSLVGAALDRKEKVILTIE